MRKSLERISWAMRDFATFATDQGVILSLTLISPQLMRLHLRAAVFRGLGWGAGAKWGVPHRRCFDVVKHSLRSKRFSAFEKGCIRAVATNA
eukprot:5820611-Pyramimonas_sp.AAC.1